MSYRRLFRDWIVPCLLGVGIALLGVAIPTLGRSITVEATTATEPAAQEVPPLTSEWAAEVATDAKLAHLEANVNRRILELESRVWELERYWSDLDRIADLVPADYRMLVVDTARAHGLDPRALAALGWVESRWDPTAVGSSGEIGIMQILPSTGEWIAEQLGVEEYDLRDPRTNVKFGAAYLRWLIEETGSLEEALAQYNGGPAWADRAPVAARAYVDRVRTAMTDNR